MKNRKKGFATLLLIAASSLTLLSQNVDSTGLPGDHFSLSGALDLLKQSDNPEEFEKALNTESNYVNNLDLNADGEIDYIRVIDHMDEDAHAIVLQAIVGENDAQDVAVVEIEKTAENEAVLQIIGDEDIYGEEVLFEPYEEEKGKGGPNPQYGQLRVVVNVWLWPSVRYIYRPGYLAWVSPWKWMQYPRWWRPWRVHPLHWLTGVRPKYHIHYHLVNVHRVGRAHRIYTTRRTTSVIVHNRYHNRISNYRKEKGIVHTKKTIVVEGPRGGKVAVQKKNTTAVGKNEKGERITVNRKTTRVAGKKSDGSRGSLKRTQTKGKSDSGKVKKTTTKARKKSPRRN